MQNKQILINIFNLIGETTIFEGNQTMLVHLWKIWDHSQRKYGVLKQLTCHEYDWGIRNVVKDKMVTTDKTDF